MPRKQRDWEAEWKAKAAEARKLAKRANQRMVRLERYAEREGYGNILNYSYSKAQKYISAVFGPSKSGKPGRFKEHQKLYDIEGASGADLYRKNISILNARIKEMNVFLESVSSTIGDVKGKKGYKSLLDKRTNTINEKLKAMGIDAQFSAGDLKRFFESKKQSKLEALYGSDMMFVIAAVVKKHNLKSNKRDLEKFVKTNIVIPPNIDPNARKGEKAGDYMERMEDFLDLTGDEILNSYVTDAIRNGLNVNNLFI